MAAVHTHINSKTDIKNRPTLSGLRSSPDESAASANEPAPVAGGPEQVQSQHSNTIPRAILPNSLVQNPLYQPANPVGPPVNEVAPQLPHLRPANERFAPQYRLDADHRMYPGFSAQYSQATVTEKPEMMTATQSAMGPQLAAFNPQHIHSPTSFTSPSHSHSRQYYSSAIPQPQYYYGTYMTSPQSQSHYAYNTTFPSPSIPVTQPQYNVSAYQQHHNFTQPQSPPQQHYSSGYDAVPALKVPIQRSPQVLPSGTSIGRGSQHGHSASSGNPQSAAPGPIRATTPTVVKQDQNGVTTISFEYSKDRVKRPYEIRCDVESVDLPSLSKAHKDENCVYPRACSGDAYRGNRWQYENECNEVAWALAWLNPELRGKRGLIQRAVDSWRNSNKDKKLRSRRVRRLAKTERREKMNRLQREQQQYQNDTKKAQAAAFLKGSGTPVSGVVGVGNEMSHPDTSPTAGIPQYHHHMVQTSSPSQIGGIAATETSYGDTKSSLPSYQQQ